MLFPDPIDRIGSNSGIIETETVSGPGLDQFINFMSVIFQRKSLVVIDSHLDLFPASEHLLSIVKLLQVWMFYNFFNGDPLIRVELETPGN